jgi:hypothetical protein
MKRSVASVLALLLVLSVGLMYAQDKTEGKKEMKKASKETTISGEVVEVSCYLAHDGKGSGHQSCAEACAKAGSPLGILTEKGKLYVSLLPDDHQNGPNAILMDHIAHKVNATGVVRSKGGVAGMMITKVEMAEDAK